MIIKSSFFWLLLLVDMHLRIKQLNEVIDYNINKNYKHKYEYQTIIKL